MLNQKSANVLSISKSQIVKTINNLGSSNINDRRQAVKILTKPSGINKMIGSMFLM